MIRSLARAFHRRQRFDELARERWLAASGALEGKELTAWRRRERRFLWWRIAKGTVRLPITMARSIANLVLLLSELERLHGTPRRKILAGKDCALDRQTWLVNGPNIELGHFVKVSAFSALIAGYEAKIRIGNNTILGPGVIVVAANHGIAMNGVPIRYQKWKEKPVVIGDDVWIGGNAVILPGSTIGAGAVIGAGTVVSGDIPPNTIVYGDKGALVMRPRE